MVAVRQGRAAKRIWFAGTVKNLASLAVLARRVARECSGGTVLALMGPLGVGKTTFVRYLARALGWKGKVPSPSFTLVQDFTLPATRRGIRLLRHIDLYRLRPGMLGTINWEELVANRQAVVAVEWAEHAGKYLPCHAWKLRFAWTRGGERKVKISRGKSAVCEKTQGRGGRAEQGV